ncbi:hypothetical protein F2P81_006169 [Scophthalmus maximus]|uniref:AP-1 complex subunit sigma-2 n=1 Tax=Scophthalmus maximus TaxID=52904 RepID=A0A6A4T8G9_SCOMX|nr:hypothetical protein F2P81_006169 [Scophthalmus maximus]
MNGDTSAPPANQDAGSRPALSRGGGVAWPVSSQRNTTVVHIKVSRSSSLVVVVVDDDVFLISSFQMQFMLLFSRQGKLRLQKWYVPLSDKEKKKITRELVQTVLARKPKMCSFLEWRDLKVVYKRYASLYFCCAIEEQDNELITLEIIHRYVELLDKYFGSVCELDIIFNFEKAYFILDEFLLGGEAQETSKKNVLKAIEQADLLQENIDFQMRLFAASRSSVGVMTAYEDLLLLRSSTRCM